MKKMMIMLLCAALLTICGTAGAEETALPEEYAEYRLIARSERYEMYLYEPTISLLLRNTENGALIASTLNEHTAQGKLNKTWKGYTFSAFVLDVNKYPFKKKLLPEVSAMFSRLSAYG